MTKKSKKALFLCAVMLAFFIAFASHAVFHSYTREQCHACVFILKALSAFFAAYAPLFALCLKSRAARAEFNESLCRARLTPVFLKDVMLN